MCKTYDVKYGTIGYDDEEKILFPTEAEAEEYFREKEEDSEED